MFRAFATLIFIAGATSAHSNEALTVTSDNQAIIVDEGQPSPWLHAEVRKGEIQKAPGEAATAYTYIHLQKPINFSASSQKDHFSANAYHVYDLSFSSNNAELSSRIESMAGHSVSVKGLVKVSPTGQSPTELHIVVTDIQASH